MRLEHNTHLIDDCLLILQLCTIHLVRCGLNPATDCEVPSFLGFSSTKGTLGFMLLIMAEVSFLSLTCYCFITALEGKNAVEWSCCCQAQASPISGEP